MTINNLDRNGCLVKITELILSNDGKYWGEKVFLGKTRNLIDRPVNRLYVVETNFRFILKGDKQGSDQKDEAKSRPKWNAAELAKLRIKYVSSINWRGGSAKYFWHTLKVKDKSHVFCKFCLVNLIVLKVARRIFRLFTYFRWLLSLKLKIFSDLHVHCLLHQTHSI